jgi:hypothetical protein
VLAGKAAHYDVDVAVVEGAIRHRQVVVTSNETHIRDRERRTRGTASRACARATVLRVEALIRPVYPGGPWYRRASWGWHAPAKLANMSWS